ncbi:MAG: hypothetical protein JWN44_6771 [Myxococcales bacterium]|nr:hypothetical protein [Myxococcales bacterium]
MAILQALLTLISRSAGKILNAIFGWAVRALFGQPSPKEQPFLTGVVAAAAAWPILLLGVAFPKVAALLVAFVPFHNRAPGWVIRVIWLALALFVPMIVGLVVASKAPEGSLREPTWKRVARGWPITIGLAASFLVMFVTVPGLKIASIVRKRRQEQVPLVTHSSIYHEVARVIVETLGRHGIELRRAKPGWWITVPTTILLKLGGDAFRGYVPDKLEYFRQGPLEAALYPSGLLLRGPKQLVARAHGLVSEALTHTEALQTLDANAQILEKRIHSLWALFDRDPVGNVGSDEMRAAVDHLAHELTEVDIPYEDWQIIYRELLQLDREVMGQGQLLDARRTVYSMHQAAHPDVH